MISASKTPLSLKNIKILKVKVKKILQICLGFVNSDPECHYHTLTKRNQMSRRLPKHK